MTSILPGTVAAWPSGRLPIRIAIATCREWSGGLIEDELLEGALVRLGARVDRWAWDDPSARWGDVDVVVVRSTWDYHHRLDEFLAWVSRVAGIVPLINPAPVLRWSSHKSYLLDLAARGVDVVPTRLVMAGDAGDLEAIMAEEGWTEVVLKPAVSANAEGAALVRRGAVEAGMLHLAEWARMDMLVQPFLPGVADPGEVSVVVIGGAVSHAVRKLPATGDFRVQEHLGGSADVIDGGAVFHDAALRAMAAAPGAPVYGRVDLVLDGEVALVAELEVLEPGLFLELVPEAAERLAAELVRNVGLGGS